MQCKAKDLSKGDVFRLHIYGEVLDVSAVANGKRIKIKLALEHQGQRRNCGVLTGNEDRRADYLEFTNAGHVLEFLCRPSRMFHLHCDYGGDGGNDDFEYDPDPAPEGEPVDAA